MTQGYNVTDILLGLTDVTLPSGDTFFAPFVLPILNILSLFSNFYFHFPISNGWQISKCNSQRRKGFSIPTIYAKVTQVHENIFMPIISTHHFMRADKWHQFGLICCAFLMSVQIRTVTHAWTHVINEYRFPLLAGVLVGKVALLRTHWGIIGLAEENRPRSCCCVFVL